MCSRINMETMEFSRFLVLLVAAHAVHSVSGQSVTRCYNEKFDSLICPPGTGISIEKINVYASTTGGPTGLCHRSRDNCTQELTHNSVFFNRVRAACDGRLTCDSLTADLDKVYCEVRDTRVDLSYITIQYTCKTEQREDFRYTFSCFNLTFDNLVCDGGHVIDVTDVYLGVTDVTTGGCSMVPVGGCVYRFPDTAYFPKSLLELCNGRVECRDARAYDRAGICQSTAETQHTMIGYQCVTPTTGITTKLPLTTTPATTAEITAAATTTTTTTTLPPITATRFSGASEVSTIVRSVRSTESETNTSSELSAGTSVPTVYTTDSFTESGSISTSTEREIIIAVPVAGVCLVIVIVLVVCLVKRNKRRRGEQADEPTSQSNGSTTQIDAPHSSDGLHALATNPDATSAETPNSEIAPYSATMFANIPSNNGLGSNKNSHRITLDMSNAPYTYDAPADEGPPRRPSAVARGSVGAYDEVQLDAANVSSASDPTGTADGIQLETYPSGTHGDVSNVAMETDDPGVTDGAANVYSEVVKPRRTAAKATGDEQKYEDDTVIVDNALYG